ncbi:tetratricopeptide repeat protein [Helicobacter trogontum]|uniref:Uncharacterized protein n=1 Tax=Helicobacter trogontum TaxID=50960 RepID=A0A4U8SAU7_9HELI|nr:hypothetical protein [Helicobacter trogontum]TLD83160.1 hypothetical protein LS81_005730 [Helicobacter trogontum]
MIEMLNAYRNPIFGILALLFMVVFVFFLDSLKRKRAHKRKQDLIDNLGKQFDSVGLQHNIDDFITHAKKSTQTLILIAQTYVKAGDYEQAIAIYKTLNEKPLEMHEKLEILELLGDSYYRAGFLERSKKIFLEILHYYPHNVRILEYYVQTCENLKHYEEAIEAINSLEEIMYAKTDSKLSMQKIWHTKNYLKVMQLCSSHNISLADQQEKLLIFYEKDPTLRNIILRHFRLYNVGLFWQKILLLQDIMPYIDILWHFQKHEVPFDIISNRSDVMAIYYAKGFIDGYQKSDDFTLEVLQLLRLHSNIKADITFTYGCHSCNVQTPFYTYRCNACSEIGTISVISSPIQTSCV